MIPLPVINVCLCCSVLVYIFCYWMITVIREWEDETEISKDVLGDSTDCLLKCGSDRY